MDVNTRDNLFQQAKTWVLEAGAMIRNRMHGPLEIDTKSNAKDLVTTMDKETERFFAEKIKGTYPDHLLFGEEGYGDNITSMDGTIWIVDPIDGTMNFVHQKRNFAISLGIYQDGVGEIGLIYDVRSDIIYSAKRNEGAFKNSEKLPMLKPHLELEESMLGLNHYWLCENRLVDERVMQDLVKKVRGTRTYGSAALEFAYVAEGIMDGYLTMSLEPWDIAAGLIIVNEVGGITTNIAGDSLNMLTNNTVITCHPAIQQSIIKDFLQKGIK